MYEDALLAFAIATPLSLMGVYVAKVFRYKSGLDPKITEKRLAQYATYIDELEADNKSLINQRNSEQKGPQIEGDMSELSSILPSLLDDLGGLVPNYVKPFFKNKDFVQWMAQYAQNNPDKAAAIFGKFFRNKAQKHPAGIAAGQITNEIL